MTGLATGTRVLGETRDRIVALLEDYVDCLDHDRLEDWPGFFVEDCAYRILSRENVENGLPLAILNYGSCRMLRDRVLVLRRTAIYAMVYNRHLISSPRIFERPDGAFELESNFAVYKTDILDGETWLFTTGQYRDVVVRQGDGWKFQEKVAIMDSYSVLNHLAEPI